MRAAKLLPFALLLAAAGCNRPAASPPVPPAPAAAVVELAIVQPQWKSVRRVVEQPGTVQADEETQLFAKLPGYVRRLYADRGKHVKGPRLDSAGKEIEPGEILAEIAIPELHEEAQQKRALVRQAAAEVELAKKALASADANVAHYEASVGEAKAGLTRAEAQFNRWQSEYNRVAGLVQRGVIDAQTRDETENQFKAATASWEEARARVKTAEAAVRKSRADRDKSEADVAAAEARLEVVRADARRQEALLEYTSIRAPFDGVVTQRHVNTGDFLQATPGKGEGIFTVTRRDPVRIVVDVPEIDAALVQEKAPVKVQLQALQGVELPGTVSRTSWSLAPASRTLRVEIDLPNPDDRLRPGMYVYARIETGLPEGWALPIAAVVKQADAQVCFLVEDGKAMRTPVQVGRSDGQFIEVRRLRKVGSATGWADFTGKERVVTPAAKLTDGQPVP